MSQVGALSGAVQVVRPSERSVALHAEDEMEVARAQADPEAFAALYRKYYPLALTYAFRRVGDRERAEEIVACAFYRLTGALGSYRRSSVPFRAWMYRIVSNEVNRSFRTAHRCKRAMLELFRRRKKNQPGAVRGAERGLDFENVRRALSALPAKYATVLALRYFEQLTTGEISQIMNLPDSTVRTRIERGLERLRVRLEKSG